MKGNGYSNDLLAECIRDAETQNKKGVCILCAEGKKSEFLADPKFLAYKGFKTADVSDCGITLMSLPLSENAEPPKFKPCAKHPKTDESGFVLYYTDQCPFTCYWVPRVSKVAKEHGIPFRTIPYNRQRIRPERSRAGYDLRVVPRRKVCHSRDSVRQKISRTRRKTK